MSMMLYIQFDASSQTDVLDAKLFGLFGLFGLFARCAIGLANYADACTLLALADACASRPYQLMTAGSSGAVARR